MSKAREQLAYLHDDHGCIGVSKQDAIVAFAERLLDAIEEAIVRLEMYEDEPDNPHPAKVVLKRALEGKDEQGT
jgi:hypothetical protein